MKRKVLSVIISMVLVLTFILPISVFAEKVGGDCGDGVTWSLDEGVLTVSGNGKMDDFATYEEVPWYGLDHSIKSIVLENGITHVGGKAFSSIGYPDMIIPESVTTIGENAFSCNPPLSNIYIPEGVTEIGDYAFQSISTLCELHLPESVQTIGEGAFRHCVSLAHITLPSKITRIEGLLFNECSTLKSVTIPESVTYIGRGAFYDCGELTDIYYTGTKEQWDAIYVEPQGDHIYDNDALKNVTVHYEFNGVISNYDDVDPYEWYTPAVDFVRVRRLMKGISETHFDPNAPMTRGMLATVLYRLEGSPEATAETPFLDLTDEWYMDAVSWAYENGIVYGKSETCFDPNGILTREQLAVMFHRYWLFRGHENVSAGLYEFSDESTISGWALTSFKWAYAHVLIQGIPKGDGKILDPHGKATRAQVATILMRFCKAHL